MMSDQPVYIFNDLSELAAEFHLLVREQNILSLKQSSVFNLCISGGETAKSLFNALASYHHIHDWLVNCKISRAAERCVPYD